MRSLVRSPRTWAGAAILSCVASCSHPKTLPPLPDDTSGQRAAWQLAPEDTEGGVVVGDLGRQLDRLRALKTLLDSGPVTRTWIQKGMAQAMLKLGFDPLDPEGWKSTGVDPNGPIGIFAASGNRVQMVFKPTDGKKAESKLRAFVTSGDNAGLQITCDATGALYHCGNAAWSLAADPTHSIWARMEQDLLPEVRSMGTLAYVPLDVGAAKDYFTRPDSPVKDLRAGWMGTTTAPERFVMRMGVRSASVPKLAPYLQQRGKDTLLGLGEGAASVMRLQFSPDQLWSFAKAQVGPSLEQGTQLVLAMTGIDVEKELVQNLTGEVVIAGYRGAKLGPDGKPRTLLERAGTVLVLGTVDDQKTRHLVDRLGEIGGAAVVQYGNTLKDSGVQAAYDKDAGDRVVHWFSATLPPEQAKSIGLAKVDFFLTSIPGGIAIGEGRAGLAELKKRIGKRPAAFLDKLPLAEERAMFEHAPFASWASAGESGSQRFDVGSEMPELTALAGPEAAQGLSELVQLTQLLFDNAASVDVKDDRAELFYQLTFL